VNESGVLVTSVTSVHDKRTGPRQFHCETPASVTRVDKIRIARNVEIRAQKAVKKMNDGPMTAKKTELAVKMQPKIRPVDASG
jgi:hypothetical protein